MLKKEKRRLVRRELIYYLKITDSETGREIGRLGDIHHDGLLVLSPEPLPLGAVYHALLELPKAMAADEGFSKMTFEAKTVWIKPKQSTRNHAENGLHFINPTPWSQTVIAKLTELFGMPKKTVKLSKHKK